MLHETTIHTHTHVCVYITKYAPRVYNTHMTCTYTIRCTYLFSPAHCASLSSSLRSLTLERASHARAHTLTHSLTLSHTQWPFASAHVSAKAAVHAKDSDNDEGRTSPDTDCTHFIRTFGNPDAAGVVGQVCHVSVDTHAHFVRLCPYARGSAP
jgi:hypothetical protein